MTQERTSDKQVSRQRARDQGGRYDNMNECEFCGRGLGDDYTSLSTCDDGIGVALCPSGRCAARQLKMTEEELKVAILKRRETRGQ